MSRSSKRRWAPWTTTPTWYLFRDRKTLLNDAANDADDLVELVRTQAPNVSLIVTSHQHFDHWQALEAVARATGAPTAAHEVDASRCRSSRTACWPAATPSRSVT